MDYSTPNNMQSKPLAGGDAPAEHWPQHEHLAAQVELDALRLLADAGTSELAKFAIDSVDELHRDQMRREFARELGFASFSDLLAASAAIATSDDKLWFVTLLAGGHWVGWNHIDLHVVDKHASREDAVRRVERLAVLR